MLENRDHSASSFSSVRGASPERAAPPVGCRALRWLLPKGSFPATPRQKPPPRKGHLPVRLGRASTREPWQKLRRGVRETPVQPRLPWPPGGKERRGGSSGPGKGRSGVAVSKQRLTLSQPAPGPGLPCRVAAWPGAGSEAAAGRSAPPEERASRRAGNGAGARGKARLMRAAPGLHPP